MSSRVRDAALRVHACTYMCVLAERGDEICRLGRCAVDDGTVNAQPVERQPDSTPTPEREDEELDE